MTEVDELEAFLDMVVGPRESPNRQSVEFSSQVFRTWDPVVARAAGMPGPEVMKQALALINELPELGMWRSIVTLNRAVGMVLARIERLRSETPTQ